MKRKNKVYLIKAGSVIAIAGGGAWYLTKKWRQWFPDGVFKALRKLFIPDEVQEFVDETLKFAEETLDESIIIVGDAANVLTTQVVDEVTKVTEPYSDVMTVTLHPESKYVPPAVTKSKAIVPEAKKAQVQQDKNFLVKTLNATLETLNPFNWFK